MQSGGHAGVMQHRTGKAQRLERGHLSEEGAFRASPSTMGSTLKVRCSTTFRMRSTLPSSRKGDSISISCCGSACRPPGDRAAKSTGKVMLVWDALLVVACAAWLLLLLLLLLCLRRLARGELPHASLRHTCMAARLRLAAADRGTCVCAHRAGSTPRQ